LVGLKPPWKIVYIGPKSYQGRLGRVLCPERKGAFVRGRGLCPTLVVEGTGTIKQFIGNKIVNEVDSGSSSHSVRDARGATQPIAASLFPGLELAMTSRLRPAINNTLFISVYNVDEQDVTAGPKSGVFCGMFCCYAAAAAAAAAGIIIHTVTG